MKTDELRDAHEALLEIYQEVDGIADEMSFFDYQRSLRCYEIVARIGLNPYADGEDKFPDSTKVAGEE